MRRESKNNNNKKKADNKKNLGQYLIFTLTDTNNIQHAYVRIKREIYNNINM